MSGITVRASPLGSLGPGSRFWVMLARCRATLRRFRKVKVSAHADRAAGGADGERGPQNIACADAAPPVLAAAGHPMAIAASSCPQGPRSV